ncbi:unnamed protein product [Hyaloperonospora brassicae]|uniref:PTM/DIR17-like Tudor domain-containing protein n=1 Tax=Hyaloperonospora brassicae TaxID=162125 RepID=A0AAV0U491_HYABA|nr:unnamed protein product [Hyaloperonospora brassicae]
MAGRPVVTDALASSSAASTATSSSSSGFSSAPINPVVVSSHNHRRRVQSSSWFPSDVPTQKPATADDVSNQKNATTDNVLTQTSGTDQRRTQTHVVTRDTQRPIDAARESRTQTHVVSGDAPTQTTGTTGDYALNSYTPLRTTATTATTTRTKDRPFRAASLGSASCSSGTANNDEGVSGDDNDNNNNDDHTRPRPSQALPSLSLGSAALLQLRHHRHGREFIASSSPFSRAPRHTRTSTPATNATGQAQGQGTSGIAGTRSRSHPCQEEGSALVAPDADGIEHDRDRAHKDVEEKDLSAPSLPTDKQQVRILFHGRAILAQDLIGLRVAKTFAGAGRFLGQVVKFDKRTALYTVVYDDGDAEDLTVDQTLQILTQDEIERADPAQLPLDISLLGKKSDEAVSPASPDFVAPPAPASRQSSAPQRRVVLQISERETRFVMSLFENHALPVLLRRAWRMQANESGMGTCFISPSGEMLPSALDVVGYIAKDDELLASCFPANVHSAILSLLPREAAVSSAPIADSGSTHRTSTADSASRKRTAAESSSAEQVDDKRTRQVREEARGGTAFAMCAGTARSSDTALSRRHNDSDYRVACHVSAYREQGMGGRIRTPGSLIVGNGSNSTSEARTQASPVLRGYRRTAGRGPMLENPFVSRWPEAGAAHDRVQPAEYGHRVDNTLGRRERGDVFALDHHVEAQSRDYTRSEERSRVHRLNARDPAYGEGTGVGGAAASGRYAGFYRDLTASSRGSQVDTKTNGLARLQLSALRTRVKPSIRICSTSLSSITINKAVKVATHPQALLVMVQTTKRFGSEEHGQRF